MTEASGKAIFPVEDISEKTKHVVPQQQGKNLWMWKNTPLITSEMIIRITASFKVKNVFVPQCLNIYNIFLYIYDK